MSDQTVTKPNGPAAAAFIAAGIGAFALGLMTTLAEASVPIRDALRFDKLYGLGSGVGPLSGKALVAVVAFLIGWAVFYVLWRRKEVDFGKAYVAMLVLVALGFLLTFPPFFLLFEPKE